MSAFSEVLKFFQVITATFVYKTDFFVFFGCKIQTNTKMPTWFWTTSYAEYMKINYNNQYF